MIKKIFIIIMILTMTCEIIEKKNPTFNNNILNKYKTIRFDGIDSAMPEHYTGYLFMSGCADANMNKMIREQDPTNIGKVYSNKLVFFGDKDYPEEIYNFDSISYYEVTTEIDTFYIMHINTKKNSINYEIVIELNGGYNYDRALNIYKNGKLCTLILWVESLKVTPRGKDI